MALSDLTVDVFVSLRNTFFNKDGSPKSFNLRPKGNTQSDPLDEHIAAILGEALPDAKCLSAPGPLTCPDMVIFRETECNQASKQSLRGDLHKIVGLEVKKLNRGKSGQIARSTGLDYNTTPPCGTIRVYDALDSELDIPGFYLFVCQEQFPSEASVLSALTLCDGNVLNDDFTLYLQITGRRKKGIGLGTYGDGMNRNRPMLVFANPLGAPQLDHAITLITRSGDLSNDARIGLVYELGRTLAEKGDWETPEHGSTPSVFSAYRIVDDIPNEWQVQRFIDPFPKPAKRESDTQQRGKFRLPIRPTGEDRDE